jgi:hypothetical protein
MSYTLLDEARYELADALPARDVEQVLSAGNVDLFVWERVLDWWPDTRLGRKMRDRLVVAWQRWYHPRPAAQVDSSRRNRGLVRWPAKFCSLIARS